MQIEILDFHRKRIILDLEKIDIIEADTKYLNLYTEGRVYVHKASTKEFLATYPDMFIEVNRGKLIKPAVIKGWVKDPERGVHVLPKLYPDFYPKLKVSRRKQKRITEKYERLT